MNELGSKALAWSLAHWDVVLGLLGLLSYAWLNAKNARTAVEKRAGGGVVAWIDRAAVLTMKGASNKVSAPVLGKSLADAARAELTKELVEREHAEPDVSAAQTSSVYVYREGNEWIATPRTKSPILARGRTPDEAKEALRAMLVERETQVPPASDVNSGEAAK